MLKGREVKTNQIVCDGRLKASIVVDGNWVIEIHDNAMCNFQKKSDKKLLAPMARGRLCNNLVKQHGYQGYIGISLVEMEYSPNEAEYLLSCLSPVF